MKATEANLLAFLKKSPQFMVPIYQRTYSWTEKECGQLWSDIIRTGSDDTIPAHFVGSVVYIQHGLYQVMDQAPLLVIDGQQRLTTVTLLVAALAEALAALPESSQEPIEGFSPRKLTNYYLINPEETGSKHHKLLLSQADRTTLISMVDGTDAPKEASVRVLENFKMLHGWIRDVPDLKVVCRGLSKLLIVDVALTRGQDNPQLIFESMNSTGKELSQADLIRNYVLMGLDPALQTRLYEQYWRPMEVDFGQESYGTHFDSFMRHYLTLRTGEIPNQREVYEAFKVHAAGANLTPGGVEGLVQEVREYARYYCAMALAAEKDDELAAAFHDLRELKVDVAYPFLLELYRDYSSGVLPHDDFVHAVRLVESYVFRRVVCAIPTNSLNKTFATLGRTLIKDRYIESLEAQFLLLPSYRRFPRDEEFKRDLVIRDLYNIGTRRSYWPRRLENHGRKERVHVEDYTIEHIMPQNVNLSMAWQTALGPAWHQVHEQWLHTLGNLTLTGYNSEYQDLPFPKKRDMEGGFRQSPLRLNAGLAEVEQWNEAEIRARAERVAKLAIQVWAAPKMSEAALEQWRPKGTSASRYTLEDHPHLMVSPTREIFVAFRREVLSLDPVIVEDFRKQYVAYKAETNFVDAVPQSKGLRLSLNMPFVEIDDPRGMCRNMTGIGKWGNGHVQVKLQALDDLQYVIGLVRQALDRQIVEV